MIAGEIGIGAFLCFLAAWEAQSSFEEETGRARLFGVIFGVVVFAIGLFFIIRGFKGIR